MDLEVRAGVPIAAQPCKTDKALKCFVSEQKVRLCIKFFVKQVASIAVGVQGVMCAKHLTPVRTSTPPSCPCSNSKETDIEGWLIKVERKTSGESAMECFMNKMSRKPLRFSM